MEVIDEMSKHIWGAYTISITLIENVRSVHVNELRNRGQEVP